MQSVLSSEPAESSISSNLMAFPDVSPGALSPALPEDSCSAQPLPPHILLHHPSTCATRTLKPSVTDLISLPAFSFYEGTLLVVSRVSHSPAPASMPFPLLSLRWGRSPCLCHSILLPQPRVSAVTPSLHFALCLPSN